jgi:hypothetical protein
MPDYYDTNYSDNIFLEAYVGWSSATISSGSVSGPISEALNPAKTHQAVTTKIISHLNFLIPSFHSY